MKPIVYCQSIQSYTSISVLCSMYAWDWIQNDWYNAFGDVNDLEPVSFCLGVKSNCNKVNFIEFFFFKHIQIMIE